MPDITNVKIGVCSVIYNGVDLGHTVGGVEVSYEAQHKDLNVDKYGQTPIEKVLIGEKFMAKVPLAEMEGYSSSLRSLSQGRAKFRRQFHEYAPVPYDLQKRLIDEYSKHAKDEVE